MAPNDHGRRELSPLEGGRPAPLTGLAAVRAAAFGGAAGGLRGKRLFWMVALFVLPLLVQLIVLIEGEGRGGGFNGYAEGVQAYLRMIIPLALIFLGTAAFGDEWDGGTASYVVTLPLRRRWLVLGRWLSASGRALMLVLPSLIILYALCTAPFEGAFTNYFGDLLWVLLGVTLLVLSYTAVFLFIGVALKRSIMTSLILVFVFEGFIANLPPGFAAFSLGFHVRNVIWLMTEHTGFKPPTFGLEQSDPTTAVESLGFIVLVGMGLFLVASTWMLRRKEVTGDAQEQG
jgi:ABC-type transport system involved in multi-copper enzyme maturation permease subunit